MYVTPDWPKNADEDLEDACEVARRSHDLEIAAGKGEAEHTDALADDTSYEDQFDTSESVRWHSYETARHFANVDERAQSANLQVSQPLIFLQSGSHGRQDSVVEHADEIHHEEEVEGCVDLLLKGIRLLLFAQHLKSIIFGFLR